MNLLSTTPTPNNNTINEDSVNQFLIMNAKFFEPTNIPYIRIQLLKMTPMQFQSVMVQQYRDPVMNLIISIIIGHLGIDRFLLGQVGLGIAKLLTCGGLGVWTIVDWFLIMGETRNYNFMEFQRASIGYGY